MLTNHTPLVQRTTPHLVDGPPEAYQRALVEKAKGGDSDAFARLYDFYVKRVYDYMYFHIADEQTADDLTARVFLKAWRNLECYKPGKLAFEVWIYIIARSAVREFSQRRWGEAAVTEIVSPGDEGLAALEQTEFCSGEEGGT